MPLSFPPADPADADHLELPPYTRDPDCFNYFRDVTLISAGAKGRSGCFQLNMLVLAVASPAMLALLAEYEENLNKDADVRISVEMSAEHLRLIGNFLETGVLELEEVGAELRASFLCLGIDVDGLELCRMPIVVAAGKADVDIDDRFKVEPTDDEESCLDGILDMYKTEANAEESVAAEFEEFFIQESDFEKPRNWYEKNKLYKLKKEEQARRNGVVKKLGKNNPTHVFKCDYCPYKDRFPRDFVNHVLKAHKSNNPRHAFFCVFCEAGFERQDDADKHEKEAHPSRRFQCPHCSVSMALFQHKFFLVHVDLHCGRPLLYCVQCGHECKNPVRHSHHMYQSGPHHSNECVQCPKGIYTLKSWTDHQRHINEVHDGIFKHICGICPELFDSKEEVKQHHNSVHPAGFLTKVCEFCGVTLESGLMKVHLATNHKEEVEKSGGTVILKRKMSQDQEFCKLCGRKIKKDNMKRHLEMHSENKVSGGRECAPLDRKYLPQDYDMWYKGIPCIVCKKPQMRKQMYGLHYMTSHLSDEEKRFRCSYCPKGFAKKRSLQEHENTHTKTKPYLCRIENCGAAFSSICNRTAHEHAVHQGKKRNKKERQKSVQPI